MSTFHDTSFAIVARAANGVIGNGNTIPWRSAADLAHFRKMTMGKAMIMGRKTFESLPGVLPGRQTIVVTSRPLDIPGVLSAPSVGAAIKAAISCGSPCAAFVGGVSIYAAALALPWLSLVHLTEIDATPEGDVILDPLSPDWHEISRTALDRRDGEPQATAVEYRR